MDNVQILHDFEEGEYALRVTKYKTADGEIAETVILKKGKETIFCKSIIIESEIKHENI